LSRKLEIICAGSAAAVWPKIVKAVMAKQSASPSKRARRARMAVFPPVTSIAPAPSQLGPAGKIQSEKAAASH
jgi:hypothetical protein